VHLSDLHIPILFLQGGRDAMADRHELGRLVERLGDRATLKVLADADHAFHVPARYGKTDRDIMDEALDAFAQWFERLALNKS
jgi:alpha-beta hydrolase superfamily lysophospholipase